MGAVVAGLTISIVAQLKVRSDQDRFLFTASNILIGGLLCASLLTCDRRPHSAGTLPPRGESPVRWPARS